MRGAWVEMPDETVILPIPESLPVRGAWVEIDLLATSVESLAICRSPCGERGLKYVVEHPVKVFLVSLPVRGAWVEIIPPLSFPPDAPVAPRAGSVG